VSINVVAARRESALLLPPDAVESAGRDSGWVTVRQPGGTARRAVRIGIRGDHAVEILDGVAEGDSVVLRP
jgi:HlyD family secretion protein